MGTPKTQKANNSITPYRTLLLGVIMPPFSRANKPTPDFEPKLGPLPLATLLGQPSVLLNDTTQIKQFLEQEFCSRDLEIMAPHLWIMATSSSNNINAFHCQRVKGCEIVITEDPQLHPVWILNRIFVKPLPRYLLLHAFWKTHLNEGSLKLGDSRGRIHKAAVGF
jgi:hypothetical protein